jgi:tetratricopeptide (TPR) repeat protein
MPRREFNRSSLPFLRIGFQSSLAALLAMATMWPVILSGQSRSQVVQPTNPPPPIVLTVEGTNVWVQRFRSNTWQSAYPLQVLGAKDRGRTGLRSRASVRLSDLSVLRIDEFGEFEIQPLVDATAEAEFSLFRGLIYLLNRDRPGKHRFVTPTATAATRGTEFTLEVEEVTGRTILTVLEGEAELSNPAGSIRIGPGEQGTALLGQMPTKTAVIDTTNIVQWCLYYPGVLDLGDLDLGPGEPALLGDSLNAYRSGDLLRAVAAYPADRDPASDPEKIYLAALLLSVGQVAQAEAMLGSLTNAANVTSHSRRLGDAIRLVIAAVQRRGSDLAFESELSPPLGTELLAHSYGRQSVFRLEEALEAAHLAVQHSPDFAFGWTRVAELEFSHGNARAALAALEKSLLLAPRNAQALALKGFLLSAQNRIDEAIRYYEKAIEIDGGLGNAWLGRGLCRIRQGREEEGRFDLHVAAITEPQRSLLRSYLGKAFSNAGDQYHAAKELRLAAEIDPGDPTPWLYSALLLQQQNRINEGVRDLERSRELNGNRAVYRSRLLLDQDRAVTGANLANLYRDAGMPEVSVREAGRSVSADYANYSAHLFLSDSFNQLRDPKDIDLRYETAWFSERLMANLLAPVGAGTLAHSVSQQEYSKLFQQDGLKLSSITEYRSNGDWFQSAVQYGTFDNSSYALEVFYNSDNGQRRNNEVEELETVLNFKQQLTPDDSVYLRASYSDKDAGDARHLYDERQANLGLRTQQQEEPLIIAGYHHEWSPGNHTLLLASGLKNVYELEDPIQITPLFYRPFGPLNFVAPLVYQQNYRSEQETYTAELQQILQRGAHTFVAGARLQAGEFRTRSEQSDGQIFDGTNFSIFPFSMSRTVASDFDRESVYLYDQWQVWPTLLLVGGVSYDRVQLPENFRYAPISEATDVRDQVSPKAGLVFSPFTATTLRAAYYRGLGGVSLDQSVRLEPSQVAGFNQAYRSLIPESVAGANAAPTFDTWAMSLEQKLGSGTFVGVSGEILSSEVRRSIGVVEFEIPAGPGSPFSSRQVREELDFRERSLLFTFNQLVNDEWSLGARYRVSNAQLEDRFPGVSPSVIQVGGFESEQQLESTLHQLQLSAIYNHRSGFFGGLQALWNQQSNQGYTPDRPGDDFWQFNIEAGWRFFRRQVEARVALLNLTDQDYRLNPLNLTRELPRDRTLAMSLRLNF